MSASTSPTSVPHPSSSSIDTNVMSFPSTSVSSSQIPHTSSPSSILNPSASLSISLTLKPSMNATPQTTAFVANPTSPLSAPTGFTPVVAPQQSLPFTSDISATPFGDTSGTSDIPRSSNGPNPSNPSNPNTSINSNIVNPTNLSYTTARPSGTLSIASPIGSQLQHHSHFGAVIGGIIGGILLILMASVLILRLCRPRYRCIDQGEMFNIHSAVWHLLMSSTDTGVDPYLPPTPSFTRYTILLHSDEVDEESPIGVNEEPIAPSMIATGGASDHSQVVTPVPDIKIAPLVHGPTWRNRRARTHHGLGIQFDSSSGETAIDVPPPYSQV